MFSSRGRHANEPDSDARLAALQARIDDMRLELDRRFSNQDHISRLYHVSLDKAISVAQETANRAVMKAEAAAERALLEAQLQSLQRQLEAQIVAQGRAIDAALVAAKESQSAALAASNMAIHEAKESNDKRLHVLNEARGQLSDQQRTFTTKTEVDFRFAALEKTMDGDHQWGRRIDLKFSEYVTVGQFDRYQNTTIEWRRTVDAALVAAQSKSSTMYSILALSISVGGFLVVLYNLFTKAPLIH